MEQPHDGGQSGEALSILSRPMALFFSDTPSLGDIDFVATEDEMHACVDRKVIDHRLVRSPGLPVLLAGVLEGMRMRGVGEQAMRALSTCLSHRAALSYTPLQRSYPCLLRGLSRVFSGP